MPNFKISDTVINVSVTASVTGSLPVSEVVVGDTVSADAFERLRVSNPHILFQSFLYEDADPVSWDTATTGSGATAYATNQASVTLTITSGNTGTAIRQSYQHVVYQPGNSQLMYATGVMGTGVTNATKRVGIFDSQDGIFFQQSGTTLSWVIRSYTSGSAVDTVVNQDDWNLDKLDGTGSSGITFDPTKVFLMIIDFAWLGVGRVRCGFIYDGLIVYAHQFLHSTSTLPYMSRADLPIRYDIEATSAVASDATLRQICSAVFSEGDSSLFGKSFTIDTGVTAIQAPAAGNVETPLLAVRLKSGFEKRTLFIDHIHATNITANSNVCIRLYIRPTLGNSPSWTSITNSAVEYSIYNAATNAFTFSGGFLIDSAYMSREVRNLTSAQPNYSQSTSAGINDTVGYPVLLTAQTLDNNANCFGSIAWIEL